MTTAVEMITVAVDGSPAAGNAVRWACVLAGSMDGVLRFIHVVSRDEVAPFPAVQRGDPVADDVPASSPAIEAARRIAEEAAPDVTVIHDVLHGPVGATIVAAAQEGDLLVLGRKARRRPGWLRPGSTSHAVADGAACPVVLVPGQSGEGRR